jgi:hypothetical protein
VSASDKTHTRTHGTLQVGELLKILCDYECVVSDKEGDSSGVDASSRWFFKAVPECGVLVVELPPFQPTRVSAATLSDNLLNFNIPSPVEDGDMTASVEVRVYSLVRLDVTHSKEHSAWVADLLSRSSSPPQSSAHGEGNMTSPFRGAHTEDKLLDTSVDSVEEDVLTGRKQAVARALEQLTMEMQDLNKKSFCQCVCHALRMSREVPMHAVSTCVSWSDCVYFDLVPSIQDTSVREWRDNFVAELRDAMSAYFKPVQSRESYYTYQYMPTNHEASGEPLLVRLLHHQTSQEYGNAQHSSEKSERAPVVQVFYYSGSSEYDSAGDDRWMGYDDADASAKLSGEWPVDKPVRPSHILNLPAAHRNIWETIRCIRARLAAFLLGSRMELFVNPEQHVKLILSLLYETLWSEPPVQLCSFKVTLDFAAELDAHLARQELCTILASRPSLEMRKLPHDILVSTAIKYWFEHNPSNDGSGAGTVLPYWLLLHLDASHVHVLLQRPSGKGPDYAWVSSELHDCVCDCNRILLLRQMFETRTLNMQLLTQDALLLTGTKDSDQASTNSSQSRKEAGTAQHRAAPGPGHAMEGPAVAAQQTFAVAVRGKYACETVHVMTLTVHERLNVQEGITLLKAKALQPLALADSQSIFVFRELTGAIFYLIPTPLEGQAVIQVHVHGVSHPSTELTHGLAGVLQSCLDEMLLKVLAVQLMRNPHCRVSAHDVSFIAPAHAPPALHGRLRLKAHGPGSSKLAVYLYRCLVRVMSPLKLEDAQAPHVSSPSESPRTLPDDSKAAPHHARQLRQNVSTQDGQPSIGRMLSNEGHASKDDAHQHLHDTAKRLQYDSADKSNKAHAASKPERPSALDSEQSGVLAFKNARLQHEPHVSFIYGWFDDESLGHATIRRTSAGTRQPDVANTTQTPLPVIRAGNGLAIVRFSNLRQGSTQEGEGEGGGAEGGAGDACTDSSGMMDSEGFQSGVSFQQWVESYHTDICAPNEADADTAALSYHVQIWSRGQLNQDALLQRIIAGIAHVTLSKSATFSMCSSILQS